MCKIENSKYKFLLKFVKDFEKIYGKENLTVNCNPVNSIDDYFDSDVMPEFHFLKKNIFDYSDCFTFKESIWVQLKIINESHSEVKIGAIKSIKGNYNSFNVNIEEKSVNKIEVNENTDVAEVFNCLEKAMEEVNRLLEDSINKKIVCNHIDSFIGAEKYSYI